MEDESGQDEKILAVPAPKLDPTFDHIKDINDVSELLKQRIQHFFESYKLLDKNKWVKIIGWDNATKAQQLLQEAIERAGK